MTIKKLCFIALTFCIPCAFALPTIQGTQQSFVTAFETLLRSDGAIAEEWSSEIGELIKTHPTNFLKALKLYRKKIERLDSLVGNLGPKYVDDFPRQKRELQNRVQALKSVRDITLKPLAAECTEVLQRQIKIVSGP